MFIIHGLGGVGKSTLLIMFRLLCKERKIPVAIASGSESATEVEVLQIFAENLAGYGIKLPSFNKSLKKYRAIQAKVSKEANKLGDTVSEAVSTVVESLGSGIPFVNPIAKGAAVALEWLRGFLSKSDLDLLLDPAKRLTHDFLSDLAPIAEHRRLVLMLDHYEYMTAVDQWVRDLAHKLPLNLLLVISGRESPGPAWDRDWQGWIGQARIEELKEMSKENMRTLARRYYFMIRGSDPDPLQVDEIIKFARGLPLVVTATVGLWVRYGVEDFSAVKPQVAADLADRIMEGVPASLRPLLEAAASVRWFNKDILKVITGSSIDDGSYVELRKFEFMRPRSEGLFMHDVMREIIDDNLKNQNPTQHKTFHEAAALYFEDCRRRATDDKKEPLLLEQLYHLIRADEEVGMKFFCQLSEEMSRAGLVRHLRTLVGEIDRHSLLREANRLWRDYYATRVLHLEAQFQEAEVEYQSISSNAQAQDLLKAYSLCDLGNILTRWERLGQPDGPGKADGILKRALDSAALDIHLSGALFDLARVYEYVGKWDHATDHIEKARAFFAENNDSLGMVYALNALLAAYVLQGNWRGMIAVQRASLDLLRGFPEYAYLKAKTLGYWSWAWPMAGRCAEAESNLRESLIFIRQVEDVITLPTYLRNLGLSIGMQRRYDEAYEYLDESLKLAKGLGDEFVENWATSMKVLGMILIKEGNYIRAKECLDKSLSVKVSVKDNLGISEAMVWQGALYEAQQVWDKALEFYQRSLEWRSTGRRYYETAALVGLCRVKYQQGRFSDMTPLMSEAENLGIEYGYYDHLSSLRLVQGHLAWEAQSIPRGTGFEAAHNWYHQALVCALRYNRFLLDDTLESIVTYCCERGGDGRQMLVLLRDSWSEGRNEVCGTRPDSISPVPEGVLLPQAEDVTRKGEPGNRDRQETVLEKLGRSFCSG